MDGTFDVTVNVDPNGEMLPVDAVSFDIEIEDSTTPGTVVYTETINLSITDLKQNVIVTSIVEDKVGKIDIAFDNVIEAGKVRDPTDNHSDEMKPFIKDNSGGTFTLAGENADKFRIDAQTGEVVSKVICISTPRMLIGTNMALILLILLGQIALRIKLALRLINSTADDNPTQASGRPLVGVDAIEASSIISEKENLTIFGNVGTPKLT